jgi:hypothetical protein
VRDPLARILENHGEFAQYIRENDDTVVDILRVNGTNELEVAYKSPTYEVRQEAKRRKWEAFLNNGARVNRAVPAPEKAIFRPKSRLG